MPIAFIGGTTRQQAVLNAAAALLTDALGSATTLPASPALQALFGAGTSPATVNGNYAAVLARIGALTITFDLTKPLSVQMMDGICMQIVNSTTTTATAQVLDACWQQVYLDSASGTIALAASLMHELGVAYAGLLDFEGSSSLSGAQALAASDPASASVSAMNYVQALYPLLELPPPPPAPGGIAIPTVGTLLNFYQTVDGSVLPGMAPLVQSPVTAPPLGYGRLAMFGESGAQMSALHAYDTYQGQDLWPYSAPIVSGPVDATPVATGNTVWFCTGQGNLVSVDMTTPATPGVQSALTFMNAASQSKVTATLLGGDGATLYAVSSMGVYALTLGSQPAIKWSARTSTDFSACGATLAAGLPLAAAGSTLYGFKADGSSWTLARPAAVTLLASPGSGQALLNGQGDSFDVVDTATKAVAANVVPPGITGIDFSKVLLVGDRLVVPARSGQLAVYAWTFIDLPGTWWQCWSVTLSQPLSATPTLLGTTLMAQDGAGNLSAFDLYTGARRWRQTGTATASAALGASAMVNEADAALYPQGNFAGTPALVSALPSPLPAIASAMPGPSGSYALPSASGTTGGEIYLPSAALALSPAPTAIAGWGPDQVGALLTQQSLPYNGVTTRAWVRAATINCLGTWFVRDSANAVFGPNVAMIDFNGSSLPLASSVTAVVAVGGNGSPVPAGVQTALAMSGSTAQDTFQLYPGDLDFTERVNINAATLAQAQATLGTIVRSRGMTTPNVPGILAQLVELKFGIYPYPFQASGSSEVGPKGAPIAWTPAQITAGQITGTRTDTGQSATIAWADVSSNPGWIKFDWIFSNPSQQIVMNTSNVLDPTWQDPVGNITTMDGAQDAFLQEIYLDTRQESLVASLYAAIGADLRAYYLAQLALEVKKFGTPGKAKYNLGKVAKRLYNLTRMSGRLLDAVYLQSLFSAPIALVYQIWSRIKGVGEAATETSIPVAQISAQTQALLTALQAQQGLDATSRQQVATDLQAIITALAANPLPSNFDALIDKCQLDCLTWVNSVFNSMLRANAGLQAYIDSLVAQSVTAGDVARSHPRIYEGPDDWS